MAELVALVYNIYTTAETALTLASNAYDVADSIYEKLRALLVKTQGDLGYMYFPQANRYIVNAIHIIKYPLIVGLTSNLLIRDPTIVSGSLAVANDVQIVLDAAFCLRNARFPSGGLYFNVDDQDFRLALNDVLRLLGRNYDSDTYTHAVAQLIRLTSLTQFNTHLSERIFDRSTFETHYEVTWRSDAFDCVDISLEEL